MRKGAVCWARERGREGDQAAFLACTVESAGAVQGSREIRRGSVKSIEIENQGLRGMLAIKLSVSMAWMKGGGNQVVVLAPASRKLSSRSLCHHSFIFPLLNPRDLENVCQMTMVSNIEGGG